VNGGNDMWQIHTQQAEVIRIIGTGPGSLGASMDYQFV
jgi:hypothetical protein